ncbi:MAG: metallophosphoesterase family protein, partial [Anaerolineales bacterium]|nr:metallophosphoesterase family protein [Anaerolineales bacterium]
GRHLARAVGHLRVESRWDTTGQQMKPSRLALTTLSLVALALSAQGCGLATQLWPQPTATATALPTPTATLPPTASPTITPTSTPLPTPTPIPTPAAALVHGPYLQSVTTNSVIVVWDTNLPSAGEVAYGESADYTSQTADPAIGVRHAVTLTNLAPYTLYHYRIQTLGWPLSEDFTFRTAADPSQTSFTFAVFGDTRTGHEVHRSVIDRLVALAPDFALHTGDLVGDGLLASEWARFLTIEAPLMARVPLFPTLGNHEAESPLYFDTFYLPGNEHWYTFDYGNARFVCVDVDGYAHFGTASEQYAWLEATLAANTQPWLFVYLHVPPYSSLAEDSFEVAVRQSLTPLFERTGVDAVFAGHHHNYQRSIVNGITYLVTGGGGAELYNVTHPAPELITYRNVHHVMLFHVSGDTLTAEAMTPEGEVFDQFSLTP